MVEECNIIIDNNIFNLYITKEACLGSSGYEDYTPVERVGALSFFFSKELRRRVCWRREID
jgi:hypothetical protein